MHFNQYYQRRIVLGAAVMLLLAIFQPLAEARFSNPDTTFVKAQGEAFSAYTETLLARLDSQSTAFYSIGDLVDRRYEIMEELGKAVRLTSLDGIETLDLFDIIALDRIAKVLDTGRALPAPPILEQERKTYSEVMGVVPDLGFAPAPYVIFAALDGILVATEDLRAKHPEINPAAVSSMSLDLLDNVYKQLRATPSDEIAASQTKGLRQDSVIERLRCETDGSTYRVRQIKNKLLPDESVSVQFHLRCNICYTDRQVWFMNDYVSKLFQAEKLQNLTTKPKPINRNEGLEP